LSDNGVKTKRASSPPFLARHVQESRQMNLLDGKFTVTAERPIKYIDIFMKWHSFKYDNKKFYNGTTHFKKHKQLFEYQPFNLGDRLSKFKSYLNGVPFFNARAHKKSAAG
jgi:hypothetical protein